MNTEEKLHLLKECSDTINGIKLEMDSYISGFEEAGMKEEADELFSLILNLEQWQNEALYRYGIHATQR